MPPPVSTLDALFVAIEEVTAELAAQLGRESADAALLLVRSLIARLPHKYLLAATKAEIQAAGRAMLSEGSSRDEMRLLQGTLVALLDAAVRAGACRHHALRDGIELEQRVQQPPEAALVVARKAEQLETIDAILRPVAVQVHAELADDVALEKVAWFPFMYLLCTYPFLSVPPITFLETVRGSGSLCRTAGLVLIATDEQAGGAMRYVGRGANRVVRFGNLAAELPAAMAELGAVSKRVRLDVFVRAFWEGGTGPELWQAENVSATGMLLRTQTQLPKGTEVELELKLPGDTSTIRTRTLVVRHTTLGREDVLGLGVRFLSFEGDGQQRLEDFQLNSAWSR